MLSILAGIATGCAIGAVVGLALVVLVWAMD